MVRRLQFVLSINQVNVRFASPSFLTKTRQAWQRIQSALDGGVDHRIWSRFYIVLAIGHGTRHRWMSMLSLIFESCVAIQLGSSLCSRVCVWFVSCETGLLFRTCALVWGISDFSQQFGCSKTIWNSMVGANRIRPLSYRWPTRFH